MLWADGFIMGHHFRDDHNHQPREGERVKYIGLFMWLSYVLPALLYRTYFFSCGHLLRRIAIHVPKKSHPRAMSVYDASVSEGSITPSVNETHTVNPRITYQITESILFVISVELIMK